MSGTCARVRLRFEQPAPLVCGSGPGAWLLVDMESCRLVADLEFLIKRRFGLSKRRRLHLWLDGFLLPPTEKIAVVRDGDVISVEQTEESTSEDCFIPPTSGNQVTTSERRQKKRKAQTSEEDEPDTAKLRIQNKDRKRKKQQKSHVNGSDSGVSTSSSAVPVPSKVADTKTKEVQKAQTKKKEKKSNENPGKPSKVASIVPKASGMGNKKDISKPATSKCSAINGGKQNSTKTVKPVTTKSREKAKNSSSSSSSEDTSSSSEDTDSDSSSSDSSSSDSSKEVKPRSSANTKTCSRPGLVSNPQQRKNKPFDIDTSSSDSSSSDTDGDISVNKQTRSRQAAVSIPAQRQLQSNPQQNGKMMSTFNAGTVSSVAGTISQAHMSVPTASPLLQARDTRHVSVLSLTVPISQRPQAITTGKQQAASSSHPYSKGKATGPPSKGHIVFDSDSESDHGNSGSGGKGEDLQVNAADRVVASHIDVPQASTTQAPHQAFHERRKSPGLEEAPSPVPPPVPKDYAAFPLLHGPPRVGDRIAYKILEMSANYCPEISSYKEAIVTGYDLSTGDLQLDMVYDITAYMKENQPGRFEMEVDLRDQVDKTDNKVTVAVSALVEPRLVQD